MFCQSIWHIFRHFIWHKFWHFMWHIFWHFTGHISWHVFWHSSRRLGSGSAHCIRELATRRGGGGRRGRRKEEGEDRTPLIKSNNPDLAGREKNPHSKTIPLPFCNAYLLVAVGWKIFPSRPFYSSSFHSGFRGLKPRFLQYCLVLSTGFKNMAFISCFAACSWKQKQQQEKQHRKL